MRGPRTGGESGLERWVRKAVGGSGHGSVLVTALPGCRRQSTATGSRVCARGQAEFRPSLCPPLPVTWVLTCSQAGCWQLSASLFSDFMV